ncbi:hypothetical protein KAU11_12615 [Candidatus Babeliales bacterium]|nr:hypothetical protein [Candidatus Babeliales bacterium]
MSEFKFFRVTIPVAVDTLIVGEGFIDDKASQEFATKPTLDADGILKEQANMRWEEIIKMIQETGASDIQSIDVTTGDRNNANIEPTVITFTVKYGADQIVWMYDLVTDNTGQTVYGPASLAIAGKTGVTYTSATELEVIERAVATALSHDAFTDQREIWVSTLKGGSTRSKFDAITVAPFGTGADHAAKMASVEGVVTFTVTQLAV